ncbi:MAG: hypothetical protein QXK76_02800 [Candidatus Woesearchaeota archaeon]
MKKGQVTIFVILGIMVLLIVGFFVFMNFQQKKSVVEFERTTVSEQFKPIQLFVEDCINNVATEAIENLGKHGGYIDPMDYYLSGRVFYFDVDNPTESDLMFINKDPEKAIAYWLYSYDITGCDNCLIMSQMPYLDEVERQISIYVSENIDYCLNDMNDFIDQGYNITVPDLMRVNTIIRDDDVIIRAKYPINITYKGSSSSIENYETKIDIPLLKYYELASNITIQQYNSMFLEKLNIYLISSYSGLDSKLLPPFYDYSSSYKIVMWYVPNVRDKISQLLNSYIPLMQVKGTKRYREIKNNNLTLSEKNFIDLITLDFFPNKNLSKTEISFIYNNDLSLYIQPSKNDLLLPFEDYGESGISFIPSEKSNTYQYFYDISYPIIIEIKDEYKPGKYYTFMFALESNIKQNLPLKEWLNASNRPLLLDDFNIKFNDPLLGQKIRDPRTGKEYAYKERTTKTLFCNKDLFLSGNVYFKVYDAETRQPLKNVDVYFGCGNYAACSLGKTEWDSILSVESFNKKFPVCMNGYLQLKKSGYKDKFVKLSTSSSNLNLGSIYLEPLKKINVTIELYQLKRNLLHISDNYITTGFTFPNQTTKPLVNDTVIITIKKIPTSLEDEYIQNVFLTANSNNTEIELIPGSYTISGKYISSKGYVIPKECKTECSNYVLGICTKHIKVPSENIEIVPALLGGVEFNEDNPLIIKRSDLNKKKMVIYVLGLPPPACIDDIKETGNLENIVKKYQNVLKPKFE